MSERRTNPHTRQRSCLILAPRGLDLPMDLLGGLRRRGIAQREVCDAPMAMVELARHPYTALILVEPHRVPETQPLVATVRHYHPGLPVWQYRLDTGNLDHYADTGPRQAPASQETREDMPAAPREPAPSESPAPQASQSTETEPQEAPEEDATPESHTRFTEAFLGLSDKDWLRSAATEDRSTPLLTDDELNMLLQDAETDR